MNYYAVQVKIGSECNVATKLLLLMQKSKIEHGINDVVVPFKNIERLDLDQKILQASFEMFYSGYIFIITEELTHEIHELIRCIGSIVIKVLPVPLLTNEIENLKEAIKEEYIEIAVSTDKAKDSIEKVNGFCADKKPLFFAIKKTKKRTFLNLRKSFFKEVICDIELTLQQLILYPSILFQKLYVLCD